MAPTKLAFLLLEKDEEGEEKMAGVTRLELATSCVTASSVAKSAGNYASFQHCKQRLK